MTTCTKSGGDLHQRSGGGGGGSDDDEHRRDRWDTGHRVLSITCCDGAVGLNEWIAATADQSFERIWSIELVGDDTLLARQRYDDDAGGATPAVLSGALWSLSFAHWLSVVERVSLRACVCGCVYD